MDMLRFLHVMEQMLTSNGHFVGWLRVHEPIASPADGWLVIGRDGQRFLVTCREVADPEAAEIALRSVGTSDDPDVGWAPHAPLPPVEDGDILTVKES